ncbi:Ni/Fe hydrogenase subunit alpha [Streptomyces pluripotens]|uniref:Ni/Fe hydrogenase subunit alpha n=1 Tax=Streptomyces pluripotens TaxID=1355015 RepID=A0A221NSL3_9ACTN|nr:MULTISPECIES: nickel-dependent hydrogenase large subunit [Streptomyces]ARP68643.1 Ni/Fe hydrogenase subunit alpha [Streptomyces pluripotens]ASN22902.1 Ni/Fe hydrogenase subunit alpha [Streptomyces pluripotens]KIE26722.1 dehydrogenase [Streptomyces sp. MUSC 125]MCH0559267.1 nickel-dependent hydrogenase large subunit [Streptomyces sp. MUM 16J]
MSHRATRVLRLDALARVEGEGSLHLRLHEGRVAETRLRIYEPPRFFEAFLMGRGHTEPPDITARICGICPVAYQMSACQAIEDACGVRVDGPLAELRRLLYCGEWIESHTLHIHLLHAPDFLGCPSAVEVARGHRRAVERGLRIKQTGNAILEQLGGRPIHPVNVRVGGFHRTPQPRELRPLAQRLRQAREEALETVRWVAGFEFPDAVCDHDLLALCDPGRYAIDSGTPAVLAASDLTTDPSTDTTAGAGGRTVADVRDLPLSAFEQHVQEDQVPYSTALTATLDGRRHLTGPLARYAVNGRWLHPVAAEAARDAGLGDASAGPVRVNPFRSIVVRAVEVVHAIEEALRIIDAYEPPAQPAVEVSPRRAVGAGATEAPRGLLYHRYGMAEDGTIDAARIVPPTAQNQRAIEEDVRRVVQSCLDRRGPVPDDEELTLLCERAVRNHDPCISCAAHFLDLTVERT